MRTNDEFGLLEDEHNFISRAKIFVEKFDKEYDKLWNAELPAIYEDFCEYQRTKIEAMFKNAVDKFYSSYTPKVYERTFGLYNVLSLKENSSGYISMNEPGFDSFYDESLMHANRSGNNTLFDLVFKEGYHGGADSGDVMHLPFGGVEIRDPHPNTGTPYYRKHARIVIPGKRGRVFVHYGTWGRKAKRAKISPYKMIADDVLGWIGDGEKNSLIVKEFSPVFEAHLDKIDAAAAAEIPRIAREVFF